MKRKMRVLAGGRLCRFSYERDITEYCIDYLLTDQPYDTASKVTNFELSILSR